jgi:hypothetical protein
MTAKFSRSSSSSSFNIQVIGKLEANTVLDKLNKLVVLAETPRKETTKTIYITDRGCK